MWPTTSSVDTLTRPRIAVALVSAVAAASLGYYAYHSRRDDPPRQALTGSGIHRSNAIRRPRPRSSAEGWVSSPSDTPGDENADANHGQSAAEAETVVDADTGDDWWAGPADLQSSQRAGHNIVNLLFRVSEDNARRNGCVHRGCQCNSCGMVPIRGDRYRCANCADFDLCETCEAQGAHTKTHVFYKIKVPAPPFGPRQMQPVWYTGDPDSCRRCLPRRTISRLSRDTGFERPELEAFWEQWTYMASTEWRDDPDELGLAMDRKTFERCLVPTGGSRHAAPNLIHDRMFAFYDANQDDLIGFSEFLHGLSYRKREDKLRKVFEGYDIDGDGYVSRRDFLRMFRAYYVLYKQMHKDILDGLEDQLLASAEAQQLVSSRQPLSSLFGREGRIPQGDSGLRFEGKTSRTDGSVEVADSLSGTVTENRADTAARQDILTSLFAYDSDTRPRCVTARNDADANWRTVRRVGGAETDRVYWSALLDPPNSLEELETSFNSAFELGEAGEEDGIETSQDGTYRPSRAAADEEEAGEDGEHDDEHDDEHDEDEDEDEDEDGPDEEGDKDENKAEDEDEAEEDVEEQDGQDGRTYSELRARALARSQKMAPRLEKRRRDMARKHLHDRWKRRLFYLDEEEGGMAPADWEDDEDVLVKVNRMVEESKKTSAAASAVGPASRSRSSSKVRFAEDTDDFDIRSNPSTSSRSVPERWGGMEVPDAERDAGKEILYQVTQQAFNELLDTIFKEAEDLAVAAAETAENREKFKDRIEAMDHTCPTAGELEYSEAAMRERKSIFSKTLAELLADSGYTVVSPDEAQNGVEPAKDMTVEDESAPAEERRDPTMPQFRPNSSTLESSAAGRDVDPPAPTPGDEGHALGERRVIEPSEETLRYWRELTEAEDKAKERGGWGRLDFDEFEEIHQNQEDLGNRLDYLGSWIDFCIP